MRKNTAHVVGLGLNATDTVLIVRHFPAPAGRKGTGAIFARRTGRRHPLGL
ncbi:MAG: hypothetical protein ABSH01_06650 [Terriglobia bacterium]